MGLETVRGKKVTASSFFSFKNIPMNNYGELIRLRTYADNVHVQIILAVLEWNQEGGHISLWTHCPSEGLSERRIEG